MSDALFDNESLSSSINATCNYDLRGNWIFIFHPASLLPLPPALELVKILSLLLNLQYKYYYAIIYVTQATLTQ